MMVRVLSFVSFSILVVASAVIGLLFTPVSREDASVHSVDFPPFAVGETRNVRFTASNDIDFAGAYDNEADRQRRRLEQLRDWCLLAVITASNLPAKEISEATYDLPTVRQEAMRRIATFEYGETRSRVISQNDVIALIPHSSDLVRAEYLGHIADEQRKNLGVIPTTFHVFEYVLKPGEDYAELTRLPAIKGAELFTDRYGYHERPIRSRQDLEKLLAEIDDLTMARRDGMQLTLGGRHLFVSPYKKIGLEEVATIWRGQQGLPEYQGVGFSLDPRLDVIKAAQNFEFEFADPLIRYYGVDPALVQKARAIITQPVSKSANDKAAQVFDFTNALLAACAASADPEKCLDTIGHTVFDNSFQVARYEGNNLAGTEVGMVLFYTDLLMKLWSFDFEHSAPREVAGFPIQPEMRLSPIYRGEVERAPETRLWLEPLDRGYQITDERDSILFARNATRVSARAHSFLLRGDRDVEPNIFDRVLIDWWNDHYEEIASYEPQYQRLNEIIKWGVVVAWLDLEKQLSAFAFLSDAADDPIAVNRNHRLPIWKDQHQSELRFKGWDKVKFDRPEQARAEYESLALLHSRDIPYFGGPIAFQGGVSLSTRATVAERAATSGGLRSLEATARRAGVDTRLTNLGAGRLRTLDATSYEFKNFSQQAVSTLARAKPSVKLRDAFGEIENIGFDRTVRRTTDGLLLRTQAEGSASHLAGELGDLRIASVGREFQVGWESRDLDLGYSLARRMSTAEDAASVLSGNHNVKIVISLDGNKSYLVKVRGSDTWIKFAPAHPDSRAITPEYHARIAGVGDTAKTIDVAWLNTVTVRTELESGGYIQVMPPNAMGNGIRLQCCARAPPQGATEIRLKAANQDIPAFTDRAGAQYVRAGDLPEAVRSDLGVLTGSPRELDWADIQLARNLEHGEFRVAADALARNRLEYEARLQRILHEEIQFQRVLAEQQQPQMALARADETMQTYGATPQLAAHKAVLKVQSGNIDQAAVALNSIRGARLNNMDSFLDEMKHVVARAQTPVEQANQARIIDWAQWKSLPGKSGEVLAKGRGELLTLELRVQRLPTGRVVQANELDGVLENRQAVLYIHDHPALNNLDVFTSPGRRSLYQLVENRHITVYELEMDDVGQFRPAVIRQTSTNHHYTLNSAVGEQIATQAAQAASNSGSNQNCDDEQVRCKHRVYVVEVQN